MLLCLFLCFSAARCRGYPFTLIWSWKIHVSRGNISISRPFDCFVAECECSAIFIVPYLNCVYHFSGVKYSTYVRSESHEKGSNQLISLYVQLIVSSLNLYSLQSSDIWMPLFDGMNFEPLTSEYRPPNFHKKHTTLFQHAQSFGWCVTFIHSMDLIYVKLFFFCLYPDTNNNSNWPLKMSLLIIKQILCH